MRQCSARRSRLPSSCAQAQNVVSDIPEAVLEARIRRPVDAARLSDGLLDMPIGVRPQIRADPPWLASALTESLPTPVTVPTLVPVTGSQDAAQTVVDALGDMKRYAKATSTR